MFHNVIIISSFEARWVWEASFWLSRCKLANSSELFQTTVALAQCRFSTFKLSNRSNARWRFGIKQELQINAALQASSYHPSQSTLYYSSNKAAYLKNSRSNRQLPQGGSGHEIQVRREKLKQANTQRMQKRRRRENRTHTACHSWRMSSDWATAGDEELDYEDKRIWRGASSGSGGGAPEQRVEWGVARPPALPPIIARWGPIDATYMTPSCLNTP